MSRRAKKKPKPQPKGQDKNRRWIIIVLLMVVGFGTYGLLKRQETPPAPAASTPAAATQPRPPARQATVRPSPPFHKDPEDAKPFPRLVPASYYRSQPLVARAYRIAAALPEVLAQQPCYCYCDQLGHGSLLDCYASAHGAG